MAYGLGAALNAGIQGFQQQSDRQAKIKRLGVIQQREDEEYERSVKRYGLNMDLKREQLEGVQRENDFQENNAGSRQELYEATHADNLNKAKTGAESRELQRGVSRASIRASNASTKARNLEVSIKKLQLEAAEALHKGNMRIDQIKQIGQERTEIVRLSFLDGEAAANALNETPNNGLGETPETTATDVRHRYAPDGTRYTEVLGIVDGQLGVIKNENGEIQSWPTEELKKQHGLTEDDEWVKLSDTTIFDKKTGEFRVKDNALKFSGEPMSADEIRHFKTGGDYIYKTFGKTFGESFFQDESKRRQYKAAINIYGAQLEKHGYSGNPYGIASEAMDSVLSVSDMDKIEATLRKEGGYANLSDAKNQRQQENLETLESSLGYQGQDAAPTDDEDDGPVLGETANQREARERKLFGESWSLPGVKKRVPADDLVLRAAVGSDQFPIGVQMRGTGKYKGRVFIKDTKGRLWEYDQ